MKIVADDKIPFLKGALEPYAEVIYLPGKEITRDILKDVDAMLIRTRTICDEKLLYGTNVRFIGTATIGYDHIDTRYCDDHNIRWTNSPGCNSSSVQQYIGAALVQVANDFSFSLREKTIGIIGVGNVGSKVAAMAETIGMKVLLNDPPRARTEWERKFLTLDRILSESDIVTIHVPLTMTGEDKTYHLFDMDTLGRMKKGSWLFNSSRGEVVETAALISTLESSIQQGAVIDVWENEPDPDPILMSQVYIATPHIAGYSTDGKANGTAMVVNFLSEFYDLPLKNWYPANIPLPLFPEITIEEEDIFDDDIIREAIIHSYNIMDDDRKLRDLPSAFEKLRGDYPLRREFPSYSVRLSDPSEAVKNILIKLGFSTAG
ncbi:MAG: 4-phosphoerythronate dehydrogenase PdxB [Bacteroidales bacterium]|nr:4-phosphoerythronate dehydrogenase PdxB [Bacteroidales bacterium]